VSGSGVLISTLYLLYFCDLNVDGRGCGERPPATPIRSTGRMTIAGPDVRPTHISEFCFRQEAGWPTARPRFSKARPRKGRRRRSLFSESTTRPVPVVQMAGPRLLSQTFRGLDIDDGGPASGAERP